MNDDLLSSFSVSLVGLALGLFAYWLLSVSIPPAPERGRRGVERALALAKGGSFRAIEPVMRLVAGHIADLRLIEMRRQIEFRLLRSGQYLGLTTDEYLALVLLSTVLFGLVALGFAVLLGFDAALATLLGAGVGCMLPVSQVEKTFKRRAKNITRGLPPAIYIAAMCMGAGLDFPGALRLITHGEDLEKNDVAKEFALILEELGVGHTRKQALLAFAERTPTPAVVDFVRAVIQSEEKGSPLAQTLLVQAKMLNLKRSVAAEEAAARAAVLMIGPLMLLMGCILIILMGPFIVTGGGM